MRVRPAVEVVVELAEPPGARGVLLGERARAGHLPEGRGQLNLEHDSVDAKPGSSELGQLVTFGVAPLSKVTPQMDGIIICQGHLTKKSKFSQINGEGGQGSLV